MACGGCQQQYLHADKNQFPFVSGKGTSKGVIKSSTRLEKESLSRSVVVKEEQAIAPLQNSLEDSSIPVDGDSGPSVEIE